MLGSRPTQANQADIQELENLLLLKERKRLESLEMDVEKLLRRTSSESLQKDVFKTISKHPDEIVNVIHPKLGELIRLGVTNALKAFIARIDDLVERSLSIEGLLWRIQSLRTGVPLNKIIALNTFVFRVEHAFLIHKTSSKLVSQISAPNGVPMQKSSFSGLVSSITDFAKDIFDIRNKNGHSTFEIGDYRIWIHPSESFYLAIVVTGMPSLDVKRRMTEACFGIESAFEDLKRARETKGESLELEDLNFSGYLESLMVEKLRNPKASSKRRLLGTVIFSCLCLGCIFGAVQWIMIQREKQIKQENINAYIVGTMAANKTIEDIEFDDYQSYNQALNKIDGMALNEPNSEELSEQKIEFLLRNVIFAYFSPARWSNFVVEIRSSSLNFPRAKRFEKELQWSLYQNRVLDYHIVRSQVDTDLDGTESFIVNIIREGSN